MASIFGDDADYGSPLDAQLDQAERAAAQAFPAALASPNQSPWDPGGMVMVYGAPSAPAWPGPAAPPPLVPMAPPAWPSVLLPEGEFEGLVREMYLALTRRVLYQGGPPLTEAEQEWCKKAERLLEACVAARLAALRGGRGAARDGVTE
jgi:hypothetical protein